MTSAVPRRACALALAAGLAGACGGDAVVWTDAAPRRAALPPPSAVTGPGGPVAAADSLVRSTVAARLACPSDGAGPGAAASCGEVAVPAPAPAAAPAADGESCPGSLRLAEGRVGQLLAVWWAPRPEGRAWLVARRSTDGGRTWSPTLPVDTLDRSASGCERPAPSATLDTVNDYAHVAYSLLAPEGEGVFYAHQMDPRAGFEPPRVVVYGDRPSATSVASNGDALAVAYEDPNTSGRPFISVALSRTGGHTFDARVAASGRSVAAVRPAVAVRAGGGASGARLVVGWIERPSPRALSTLDDPSTAAGAEPGFVVVREGTIR